MPSGTPRFFLLTTILAGGLFALMVVIIGYAVTLDARAGDEVAPEIVRSAIGVILVGILGSLLTIVIRQHATIQEEDRRLDEYRIRQLLDIVRAYNEAKAARRALRAAGFNRSGPQSLAAWQVDEYRHQMAAVSTAELAMEKTKRELRANLGRLTRLEEVRDALRQVEDYLQTIIKEWEESSVRLDDALIDVGTTLPNLSGFVAGGEEDGTATFKGSVASRMRFIQDCIRLDMANHEKAAHLPPFDPERLDPQASLQPT
jgi:hypothetical protein